MEIMDSPSVLDKLHLTRNEIKNLRKNLSSLKYEHKKDIKLIEEKLQQSRNASSQLKPQLAKPKSSSGFSLEPIGYLRSCYRHKNGTPRQGNIAFDSRATLSITKTVFNNPEHSLEGLSEYSHVWLIFIFDKNTGNCTRSKVCPPRLNGEKLGVFATRSPHRPNPIGLTLAKLDKVDGSIICLSAVDILNGTPIIDIKPYIPSYDSPAIPDVQYAIVHHTIPDAASEKNTDLNKNIDPLPISEADPKPAAIAERCSDSINVAILHSSLQTNFENNSDPSTTPEPDSHDAVTLPPCDKGTPLVNAIQDESRVHNTQLPNANDVQSVNKYMQSGTNPEYEDGPRDPIDLVSIADWINQPPIKRIRVIFNQRAILEINKFSLHANEIMYRTNFIRDGRELTTTINNILSEEPRSVYRRNKCSDRLYFFSIDTVHVTSWFLDCEAEVLRVRPLSLVE